MANLSLTKTRIQAGLYEGVLKASSSNKPDLEALHLGQKVSDIELVDDPTLDHTWHVRLKIPAELLSDGIQTFVIQDRASAEVLDNFSVVTGEVLADDLVAEISLLRAELDMLKRAFRRHCVETS